MVSPGSHVPNLGASGAIAGVLGSYILLFPQGRVRVLQGQQVVQMPALMVIGFWIVLQLFSGLGQLLRRGVRQLAVHLSTRRRPSTKLCSSRCSWMPRNGATSMRSSTSYEKTFV